MSSVSTRFRNRAEVNHGRQYKCVEVSIDGGLENYDCLSLADVICTLWSLGNEHFWLNAHVMEVYGKSLDGDAEGIGLIKYANLKSFSKTVIEVEFFAIKREIIRYAF